MRWLRGAGRWAGAVLWVVALAPLAALTAAAVTDRGPDGSVRPAVFPAALAAFDPYVWECARNSLAVAAVATFASRVVGVGLARVAVRWRFWGRRPLVLAAAAGAIVPPAFGALGLRALLGPPEAWPVPAGLSGLRPFGAWAAWAWLGTITGAPLVGLATAAALARLDPAGEDAARLEGATRRQVWRRVIWPAVRPDVARALGPVFALNLFEPGAPLVLGLRRTLGYQAAASALDGGPGTLTRAAVLALAATGLAVAVRVMIGWWGGPDEPPPARDEPPTARPLTASGRRAALFVSLLLPATAACWLPAAGLVAAVVRPGPDGRSSAAIRGVWGDPASRGVLVNSAIVGLGALAADLALARALASFAGSRRGRRLVDRLASYPSAVPPLAVGVGVLAVPTAVRALADVLPASTARPSPAELLASAADALDPDRTPWVGLVFAVALVRLPLLARSAVARRRSVRPGWVDAARTLGANPREARRTLAGRWLGVSPAAGVIVLALAATGVTPALVLAPAADTRPLGPAVLALADTPGGGLSRASALALIGVGVNLAALAVAARGRAGLPRP